MTLAEILDIFGFSYEIDVNARGENCFVVYDEEDQYYDEDEHCYTVQEVLDLVDRQIEDQILAPLSDTYGCPYFNSYEKYRDWILKNRDKFDITEFDFYVELLDALVDPDNIELDD